MHSILTILSNYFRKTVQANNSRPVTYNNNAQQALSSLYVQAQQKFTGRNDNLHRLSYQATL